jgi:crossover junction endodeoxyribonuclease RuvC
MRQRVLGLDPGHACGWGVIEVNGNDLSFIAADVIIAPHGMPLEQQLLHLEKALETIVRIHRPTVAVVEQIHGRYVSAVISLGHFRGVLLMTCALLHLRVESPEATRIKKALTGAGNAPKQEVAKAVAEKLGWAFDSLPLDASDALAAAIWYALSE